MNCGRTRSFFARNSAKPVLQIWLLNSSGITVTRISVGRVVPKITSLALTTFLARLGAFLELISLVSDIEKSSLETDVKSMYLKSLLVSLPHFILETFSQISPNSFSSHFSFERLSDIPTFCRMLECC